MALLTCEEGPRLSEVWWAHQDSNLGPTGYEPVALTTELWALLVERETRFELAILCLEGRCFAN